MELRKHYFLDEYTIIASERSKRPEQFHLEKKDKKTENCFFCKGNETTTPEEIYRYPENSTNITDWKIRVFPNKFPFLSTNGNPHIETHNSFYTFAHSYGYHEVIVETPDHEKELSDLTNEELKHVLETYSKRIIELSKKENIKYVLVFKNSGAEAGTSIIHTHTQVAAMGIIPPKIIKEENAMNKFQKCPYCQIIESEKNSERRCFENNSIIAFTPYASKFPMEIIILPKTHKKNITEFNENELIDLTEIFSKILKKLASINAPYNFFFHYGIEQLHFHIEITPRITKWAGFELGSEIIVNSVSPEDAAKFYRE